MKKENYAIMRIKEGFTGDWDLALTNEIDNLEVVKTFETYEQAYGYLYDNYDPETHCVGIYNSVMTHTEEYFL